MFCAERLEIISEKGELEIVEEEGDAVGHWYGPSQD